MVTLVEAPRGLDMPVGSVALVDADDVRLGLAVGAGSADLFFLLGVSDAEAVGWIAQQVRGSTGKAPAAIFVKEPSAAAVKQAVALGTAVVAVEPRARWESLYKLVNHAFEHHGDRGDPLNDSGTDLFGLAQSIADRTHGMISIEDDQSHVLAYSASSDEADELRRLTILGRAGPPEHLEWIGQWGIFDALQASGDVVRVDERPELGLRPRLAVGIHLPATDARRPPGFAGTIWLQQGSAPLADDVEEVLRGGAVLAARIMSRLAAAPSTHTVLVQELLGLGEDAVDVDAIAGELGIAADGRAALVGFRGEGTVGPGECDCVERQRFSRRRSGGFDRRAGVCAVAEDRCDVVADVVGAWNGRRAASRAGSDTAGGDRCAAGRPGRCGGGPCRSGPRVRQRRSPPRRHRQVTSLDEAHTTVLLDEIVAHVAGQQRLVDPRVRALREQDPMLADTLAAYLDGFGDIAAVAQRLHVHPNTVRYRIRRIEKLLSTSLDDPEDRLVLALGLRATERG